MKVHWNSSVCCHSGNCVKSLPEVFKIVDGKFVIEPENASETDVRKVAHACPSLALRIED